MSIELINGKAAEAEGGVGFFDGTVSPRRFHIDEALADKANAFLAEAFAGRKPGKELREAFSTSDFTLAAFAQIDSEMLQQYADLPSVWRSYTDVTTVQDFRPKRLMDRWSRQLGLKLVPELTEYPTALGQDWGSFWIHVAKYGLRDAISWEALRNNEAIDELEQIPARFGRAAVETETINALANLLMVDAATNLAATVNTDFFRNYTTGDYQGVNTTPDTRPLTAENLDTVLNLIAMRRSPKSGRHTAQPNLIVIVPKALETTITRIRSLREIRRTVGDTEEVYDNYLATTDFVVEPMLDSILTHAKAATTWFVMPRPNQIRPASFAAFLRGHETPDLRVKVDAGARVGGGAISPMEGSFEIDDIQHRCRHIIGRQTGDPTFTYCSYGS